MDLISTRDMIESAKLMAASGMLPVALRGKPQDIFVILQMGQELGLKPMQAINGINVIQGKPTMAPQTMIALIYQKIPNPIIKIFKNNENEVCCTMARSKEHEPYTATWNTKKAADMKLLDKSNWKMQKENMMQWRAVAECARYVFPDIIQGFYTPDEMGDQQEIKEAPLQAENLNKKETIEVKKIDASNVDLPDTGEFIDQHAKKENKKEEKSLAAYRTAFMNRIEKASNGDKGIKEKQMLGLGFDIKNNNYTLEQYENFIKKFDFMTKLYSECGKRPDKYKEILSKHRIDLKQPYTKSEIEALEKKILDDIIDTSDQASIPLQG